LGPESEVGQEAASVTLTTEGFPDHTGWGGAPGLLVIPECLPSEADLRLDIASRRYSITLEELSLKSKITKLIAIASSMAALIVAGSATIKIG
jgi:hypothetical protein